MAAPWDCPKCGKLHPRGCHGHISSGERKGEPCKNGPRHGIAVCTKHGGNAPQSIAAAARNVEIAAAEKEREKASRKAKSLGVNPLDGDWIGALKLALARQRDLEEILMARLVEADEDTEEHAAVKKVTLGAYRVTLRDLRDTAAVMARIDLDAMEVRLEAAQLADAERAIRAACTALGISDGDYQDVALPAMAKALRAA